MFVLIFISCLGFLSYLLDFRAIRGVLGRCVWFFDGVFVLGVRFMGVCVLGGLGLCFPACFIIGAIDGFDIGDNISIRICESSVGDLRGV